MSDPRLALLEEARQACLAAALEAYEDAGLQGLCAEGRWERAIDAIRTLDLGSLTGTGNPPAGHREGGMAP